MKVLFLTQTTELGPSSRYRVYQLIPWLQKLGITCEVSPAIGGELYSELYLNTRRLRSRRSGFQTIWRKRQADLRRVRNFDAVFVQKGVMPGLYAGFERRIARERPLVIDFDDAIWLPKEGGSSLLRWMHREGEAQDLFRHAAAVIAGNEFLANYARRFTGNVTVVPSAVDFSRYSLIPTLRPAGPPVVGWMGSRTTLPYLKPLTPVFARLGIAPRVVASGDPGALGLAVDFRPWRLETELNELREFAIGIAPLPDTPWEHGKCGVKLLQYMACGIPAVASPVGVHRDIIRHEENGFLAATEKDWIEILQRLLQDSELRTRIGDAARRTAIGRFDLPVAAQAVAAVLKGLA